MSPNRPNPQDGAGSKRKSGPREYRDYRRSQQRPRHPDKEVDQRIRELDAERDPLSLPEEIVSEASKAGQSVGIPSGASDQPRLNIAQLQQSTLESLLELADSDGLQDAASLGRQELIFTILKHRMKVNGLMYGEGNAGNPSRWFRLPAEPRLPLCVLSR